MCIDLDGRMAGNGGGNAGAETVKFFIARGFRGIGGGLIDDLGEHALELGAFKANGGGLYRKCLRAKGFHLKTVVFELLGDAGKDDHLLGLQFHEHWHQQALALDAFHLAVTEDLLKKHSFVCNVLIDDPQSVVSGGQNEGFTQLAERLEGAKTVEGIGGLFGLDEGSRRGGVIGVSCCAVGVWAAIARG